LKNKNKKKLDYIDQLIKSQPQIKSGRKNYKFYAERINQTLLLIKNYFKKH
tara:strand:+ start:208 stop:360 length:153 start_codon:yes stop_codon:yes gene_type:complete